MNRIRRLSLCALVLFCAVAPGIARANGFYIAEQSAANTGRASAVVSDPTGPNTLVLNPAGLTKINPGRLFGIELGAVLIQGGPSWTGAVRGADGTTTTREFKADQGLKTPLPNLYIYGSPVKNLALGMGVYAPFGSSNKWAGDWANRDSIISVQLVSLFLHPAIAYRVQLPGEWDISIGGGFYAVWGGVNLKRGLTVPDGAGGLDRTASVSLGGNAWGFGGNAGVLVTGVTAGHGIQIGASYRSFVDINLDEGKVAFNVPAAIKPQFPDGAMRTGLTLPQIASAGVTWKPAWLERRLAISADFAMVFWSSYDQLVFRFATGRPQPRQVLKRDWRDEWQLRIGAQYDLPVGEHKIVFRAGYVHDRSPMPNRSADPILPDSNRNNFSLGVGWSYAGFGIDVGYMAVVLDKLTATPLSDKEVANGYSNVPGTYKTMLNLAALSLSYTY